MYAGGYDNGDNCTKLGKHCVRLNITENHPYDDFHWAEQRNDITLLKLDGKLPSNRYTKAIDFDVPRKKIIESNNLFTTLYSFRFRIF